MAFLNSPNANTIVTFPHLGHLLHDYCTFPLALLRSPHVALTMSVSICTPTPSVHWDFPFFFSNRREYSHHYFGRFPTLESRFCGKEIRKEEERPFYWWKRSLPVLLMPGFEKALLPIRCQVFLVFWWWEAHLFCLSIHQWKRLMVPFPKNLYCFFKSKCPSCHVNPQSRLSSLWWQKAVFCASVSISHPFQGQWTLFILAFISQPSW